ncbi:MAG TPA: M12 family metallo-peptidase [Vicinamibacterales bacterium]|nr:M12 family metallo-peptidase [Vicinamibacterales bacterium]
MNTALKLFLVLSLAVVASGSVRAQAAPEVFVDLGAAASSPALASATATPSVMSRAVVGIQTDLLFAGEGATRVTLNLGAATWIARLVRVDLDTAGFRSWVGVIEGVDHSHVVFTERDRVVSALVDAVGTVYQVSTATPGVFLLEQIASDRLRPEGQPLDAPEGPDRRHAGVAEAADDAGTIDVLILYTPNARSARGGASQMQAIASQIISDSNTAFTNSGLGTRMRLAGTSEFALTEAAGMTSDLSALSSSVTAQSLRNAARADLVQLLVNSPDTSACGFAYILRSLGSPDFPAYSVADVECVAQYTPTHELGHNMGSDHAPEDGASGGLFSYSYGFKDAARGFRTVMAYACENGCGRVLNWSNPSVAQNGEPTGTATQNNALSLGNAAFTVANFRQAATGSPTPPGSVPSAPTGLTAAVNGTTVTLGWNAVAGATGYTLQVGRSETTFDVFNGPVGNTTSVSGAVPAATYFWRLLAVNAAGSSPPSGVAQFVVGVGCTAPTAPQHLTFNVSGGTVTLNWLAPVNGSTPITYVIEAGSAPGEINLYNAGTGSTAPGAVAQAPPGTYYVRIRAQNGCGFSAPSNEQVITVR